MSKIQYNIQNYTEAVGLRLDKALSLFSEIKTRSRAEYLLEHDLVLVNGKKQKSSYKILGTEMIEVDYPDKMLQSSTVSGPIEPLDLKLDIVFEDAWVLVVNKPAGLVVHPAAGHQQDTLVNALVAHTQDLSMKFNEHRPGIVHRIDKETSGLLVVAKNDRAHEHLTQQFKAHKIHRIYAALCFGDFLLKKGTVSSFLSRHPVHRKKMSSVRDDRGKIITDLSLKDVIGKSAITHYECLKTIQKISLLKIKLETGRTHQIRVHLSEQGHPLIGDHLYGFDKKIPDLRKYWSLQVLTGLRSSSRFFLHAGELGFTHPDSGEFLLFACPWPAADLALIESLGF